MAKFKDKNEAERVKELVKDHLIEYLEQSGVSIKNNYFRCFNNAAHNHGDKNPSAGLSYDKRAFECHGCGIKGDILTACNIIEGKSIDGQGFYDTVAYLADKFNIPYETYSGTNGNTNKPKINKTAEYHYCDENGVLKYKTVRFEWLDNEGKKRKAVKPYHVSEKTGKWINDFEGIDRILYRLPEVKEAIKNNDLVFLVEGEKCADILHSLGLTATAIAGGSNAWKKPHTINYITQIANANIIILPDNDNTGNKFGENVAMDINGVVKSLKLIQLTKDIELPEKGDIEQWLQLGGTKERLLDLVAKTSVWKSQGDLQNELPPWYEVSKTGKIKIISGLLSRHLIDTIPAINTTGRFYLYDKGVYELADNGEADAVTKDFIEDRYCTMAVINDTVGLWGTDKKVKIKPDGINPDPYILNLKNGLYDIRTGELKPHTHEYISTIQLNVKYRPEAKGENFLKFINQALENNEEAIDLIQEITGYLLTTFTQAKKFFVLKGVTNTGKSTFLNVIQYILGEKYLSHIPLQNLNDRFNKAELFGKLANIVNELPDGAITDAGFLKTLIGQDPITAERKGQNPFNFTSKAKHIFACNNLPSNYGDRTDGFYKKLIIIPFENQVSDDKIDPELPEKLENEADFIFYWGIKGLQRLISNKFRFTELEESKQLLEAYKIKSNSVLAFINDRCIIADNCEVTSNELYDAYKEYCGDDNLKAVSKNKFREELESNFKGKVIKSLVTYRRLSGFKGIGLGSNDDVEFTNTIDFKKPETKEIVI